eukprot:CAMPEP_0170514554 /NCGR_PEP_ID=MMETSP0209-20121228/1129_1 /TAXON_ID=665100 ORGANISM="Litonotus pictus, Strain P1" /NCGR_SAMPLE_ID=MMETSP0209 /ASSEMBLY_ACC=CAM_ASM_000301 /LENGTH=611 /DNA_ID=CAMNT_0010798695 /DNA_START=1 /DNA_END=1833 /DNA_ORIENTATION=-
MKHKYLNANSQQPKQRNSKKDRAFLYKQEVAMNNGGNYLGYSQKQNSTSQYRKQPSSEEKKDFRLFNKLVKNNKQSKYQFTSQSSSNSNIRNDNVKKETRRLTRKENRKQEFKSMRTNTSTFNNKAALKKNGKRNKEKKNKIDKENIASDLVNGSTSEKTQRSILNDTTFHEILTLQLDVVLKSIKLTSYQQQQRQRVFHKLQTGIENNMKLKVELYGSSSTNLSLNTSDIDITVLTQYYDSDNGREVINRSSEQEIISRLISFLTREHFISKGTLQVIRFSRVPLVKFTDKETGIAVDITINQENGLSTLKQVNWILNKLPLLRDVIIIMKLILRQFGFNDASVGGLSSYMVFHMVLVYYYIETLNERDLRKESGDEEEAKKKGIGLSYKKSLGGMIVNMLHFYGYDFNNNLLGVYTKDVLNSQLEKGKMSDLKVINESNANSKQNNEYNISSDSESLLKSTSDSSQSPQLLGEKDLLDSASSSDSGKEEYNLYSIEEQIFNLKKDINNIFYLKQMVFSNSPTDGLSIQNLSNPSLDTGAAGRDYAQIKKLFVCTIRRLENIYKLEDYKNYAQNYITLNSEMLCQNRVRGLPETTKDNIFLLSGLLRKDK